MPRFFMAGTNLAGGRAIIRGRDAEHMRVLRLRPGEEVTISDGEGTDYIGRIVRLGEQESEVEILRSEPCAAEPSVRTTVMAGLPKGERADYLVQKCTEAGASEIFFFSCTRCVARANNIEKKLERWRRIAEEAAKQSGRGTIPYVWYLEDYGEVLDKAYIDRPDYQGWAMVVRNIHQPRNNVGYIVGTVSDHVLTVNGQEISLRGLCGRNAAVRFNYEHFYW